MSSYSCGIKFTCKKVKLILQLNGSTKAIRIERSVNLLRWILPINRECYLNARQIMRGIILTQEFAQVRVVSFYNSSLSLWFPQIPFQTFSTTSNNSDTSKTSESKFWHEYLPPNHHECSRKQYPGWYWHNTTNVDQRNRALLLKYYSSPPVEVETALEAWEVETRNVHTTLKRFDEDVWRDMPTVEKERRTILNSRDIHSINRSTPFHLVDDVVLNHDDLEVMSLDQDHRKWNHLSYANLVIFELNSEEMERTINLLMEKDRTYHRVKRVYLRPDAFSLPEKELAKLLVIFPRVNCVETDLFQQKEHDEREEDEEEEDEEEEDEEKEEEEEEEEDEENEEEEEEDEDEENEEEEDEDALREIEEERRDREEERRVAREASEKINAIGLRVFGRLWHVW